MYSSPTTSQEYEAGTLTIRVAVDYAASAGTSDPRVDRHKSSPLLRGAGMSGSPPTRVLGMETEGSTT
jgi:hypothetical protein